MEQKNVNVEIYDDDSVIELYDDNDQPVEFLEIASIELDGRFFELLQPVEPMEGIGEDEAIIFEYTQTEDEEERDFMPVTDEALLDRVFEEYLKAASEHECDCCDCGDGHCDCGEEGCDCDGEEGEGDCGCGCHHHHD